MDLWSCTNVKEAVLVLLPLDLVERGGLAESGIRARNKDLLIPNTWTRRHLRVLSAHYPAKAPRCRGKEEVRETVSVFVEPSLSLPVFCQLSVVVRALIKAAPAVSPPCHLAWT